jgi:hypothetical protein
MISLETVTTSPQLRLVVLHQALALMALICRPTLQLRRSRSMANQRMECTFRPVWDIVTMIPTA